MDGDETRARRGGVRTICLEAVRRSVCSEMKAINIDGICVYAAQMTAKELRKKEFHARKTFASMCFLSHNFMFIASALFELNFIQYFAS